MELKPAYVCMIVRTDQSGPSVLRLHISERASLVDLVIQTASDSFHALLNQNRNFHELRNIEDSI